MNSLIKNIKSLTVEHIRRSSNRRRAVNIMEVCGTHTMAIASSGIKSLLPKEINLISGPGCPVCVTPVGVIDSAIELSRKGHIITTFGDMIRVPGSNSSLEKEKSKGNSVKIVYSAADALSVAKNNPKKEVVFVGVGFETTSPTIAAAIKMAEKEKIRNFSVIPAFKLIPPAIKKILEQKSVKINGFLLPGHVSAIIGSKPYRFISEKFGIPCAIAGFESTDILEGILSILKQIKSKKPKIEIQYKNVVRPQGNPFATKLLYSVFTESDSSWRGIGLIRNSGLKLRKNYEKYDALKKFGVRIKDVKEPAGCLCGKVLTGTAKPRQCKYFGKKCTPETPIGPCMVSSEGTCAALYKYGN